MPASPRKSEHMTDEQDPLESGLALETTARVGRVIEPVLTERGFDLVRVRLSGTTRPVLQVMAERKDERAMTVDDCATLSRAISVVLDAEDPVRGEYRLEVSSPGLDRPLVRPSDFQKYAGLDVKVQTRRALTGRKRFRGQLKGLEGDDVVLETEDGCVKLPLNEVSEAKIVITEELLRASLRQGTERNS
ncbi:MAG: ribosome maturation factor RimP [Proteobacteria bacterium]|nr:ribosome maturation factor RimP [Pseudomonadota bacterium]